VTESGSGLIQRLELDYGAVDLRLTPDDRYVFLEINPAGQWRFVEERTGQPITDAFASLLLANDRSPESRRTTLLSPRYPFAGGRAGQYPR
jgi:hypothetical protein